MRTIILGSAAILAATAGSGVAADMPVYEPPLEQAVGHDWTGIYLGAHVGYGWGDVGVSMSGLPTGIPGLLDDGVLEGVLPDVLGTLDDLLGLIDEDLAEVGLDGELSDDASAEIEGFLGGAQVGFNFQSGRLVFGVEGDFSATDMSESGVLADTTVDLAVDPDLALGEVGVVGTVSLTGDVETSMDWLATLRGRFGAAFDRVLVYGTGGVAFAEMEGAAALAATADVSVVVGALGEDVLVPLAIEGEAFTGEGSETLVGYAIGGGVEVAFSDHWSGKVEYNYVDLGSMEIDLDGGGSIDIEADMHLVKGGVNYRF
jgi:outer membrane immunogenic protein